MKIIITESQYNKILNKNELKSRRIYKKIQEYFLHKLEIYDILFTKWKTR